MLSGASLEPEAHVRAIWAAYRRGGVDALHELIGPDVEWVPLHSGGEPMRSADLLGERGRRMQEQISATVHGYETHGSCVLVHGSLRTFRDGGFVDMQPCWVYCFRAGRLRRAAGYATRQEALAAIREFSESG
jgi:ketosteroid isomerase-like protein